MKFLKKIPVGVIVLVLVILAAIFLFRREGYLSETDTRTIEGMLKEAEKRGLGTDQNERDVIRGYLETPSETLRSEFERILTKYGASEVITIVDKARKLVKSNDTTVSFGRSRNKPERVPEKFHCERIGKNYVCNFN